MKNNARFIATKILINIEEKGAFSNIEISKNLKNLENILDEGLIREIVYGVIQNKVLIDFIISKYSKIPINKLTVKVKQILRIGIYQIVFMDRIPERAACNESVKVAKKMCHQGIPGYINAVLRNIIRNKSSLIPDYKEYNRVDYLNLKYSHPKWLIEHFIKEFGYEFTADLCEANNSKPKLNIRVNTLKITRDELIKKLEEKDINVKSLPYSKDGLVVNNAKRITNLSEFKQGFFSIQDESSMMVAEIMNPKPESIVLDVCSAPGGKTCHLAQKMNNKGKIISRDIYEHKLSLINKAAKRLEIDIIETQLIDALTLDENMIFKVDYCLVDAPCSGLGLLRRKPEIRWRLSMEDINNLSHLQYKILTNASKYVRLNGILLYSTCTISKKENFDVVSRFLEANTNYELLPFEEDICVKLGIQNNIGYTQLYPNVHGTDGFFIAKFRKIK
ncbi:16S rRNA (cytosine(967)-C(5))-methyltransferase RsmB [Abyssisolibacter fermentans]|uniref:16S rRNA (cytosine(967)-C(5))-methyltransferase RsmB n=1 Tax=Abyssisolibacter fermentans TaxID=1766203 RepID=UPI00082E596E|nr:16S rRNA (cytosine(967)-C(5))-methyltransferase RsmB [Abyssisolibacter fermentans]